MFKPGYLIKHLQNFGLDSPGRHFTSQAEVGSTVLELRLG